MADCILAMKSMTFAEKAKRTAASLGIEAKIVGVDPAVTRRGCAYGLALPCRDTEKLTETLSRKRIPYGELLGRAR